MTVSPQSRIKILDAPILAPGTCCLCGSAGGDSRKFIDFGKQLDWYGAVYFCSECINECVMATGYVKASLFNQIDQENQKLIREMEELLLRHEAVTHALSVVLGRDHVQSRSIDDFVRGYVDAVEESRTHAGTDEDSDVNDSDIDESSDVEGSNDVLDSTDIGLLKKPPRQRKSPEV